ncbi:MAG: Fe-S protein assembly chaperone HscA [Bacteroidota bacterium]
MAKISINIKQGSLSQSEPVLGIDLGTTNSLVAWVPSGERDPQILESSEGRLTPSVLFFPENQAEPVVGKRAWEALENQPERCVRSVKRLLGKSAKDVEGHWGYRLVETRDEAMVQVEVDGRYYDPIHLSSLILKELKRKAEGALGQSLSKAVITVPAYFNDSQRQATRDAGKLAGLEVLRIVNEPTAASLAYGLNIGADSRTVLVYDLGGGTFDVSILHLEDGVFEVLATHGDTALGGDDLDLRIAQWWMEEHSLQGMENSMRLQHIAEHAKTQLSQDPQGCYTVAFNADVTLRLDYVKLCQLAEPWMQTTWKSVDKALALCNLVETDIDEVVLVGGSTRFPEIARRLAQRFDHCRVNSEVNPDEVVALGAAIEADVLAGNRTDVLLLDVTPLSLGIETAGNLMDVIIPRNSKIPTRLAREYTTSVDGQVNLKIAVFQGERESVLHNRKLGEFVLSGIPAMPAGLPKIQISFAIDANGLLQVSAKELRSGMEQSIEVKPQYGLTDSEVEQRLLESMQNAKSDLEERMLTEAQNEAQQILYATQRFLDKHAQHLSTEEIQITRQRCDELQGLLTQGDRNRLLASIEALNEVTKPFAERIMDIAVSEALKGKKL